MSYPVFYVPSGDVLPIMFSTYDGGTGASVTLTGLAATDIEIYKDGGVTQRASDAGYTLLDTDGIDFDAITGIHGFSIDTGDNTDAGFYTVGAWFTVVVSSVTVDAQTVNFIAAQFRLMPAESIAGKPKVDVDAWLGTAAATPSVAGVPEVDLTHVAGATTNVAALATNVDAILTDTAVIGAAGAGLTAVALSAAGIDAIWDEATVGHVTAGTYGVAVSDILTDTSTTLQAELDGIQADTEDLQTRLPAALVGGRIDASVGAMANNVITAASINTGAIDTNAIAATAAAEIADAVWDEATAGHVTAGTYGVIVTDILTDTAEIGAAGAGLTALATQTSVNTIDDLLDTEVAAIKAKTDSLTFTIAGQVDANVQSINDVAITGDGGATPFDVA